MRSREVGVRNHLGGQAEVERLLRRPRCGASAAAPSPSPRRPAGAATTTTRSRRRARSPVNARLNPADSATIRTSAANANAAPGPGRHAVDRRDHRLGHRRERRSRSGCSARRTVRHSDARRRSLQQPDVLAQVLAHAEGAPGAGQHDAADRGVAGGVLQGVTQGYLGGDVQGVHRLRPVEPDGASRRRRPSTRTPALVGPSAASARRRAGCSWACRPGRRSARPPVCLDGQARFVVRCSGAIMVADTLRARRRRAPGNGHVEAGTRKGMPHGGHEAEDRRRPARGHQGGPGHRHARPPRGRRPPGRRDVGRPRPVSSATPSRPSPAEHTRQAQRGPGTVAVPGLRRVPEASGGSVTAVPTTLRRPARTRPATAPTSRWSSCGRAADVVAVTVARPAGAAAPGPGALALAVAERLGLDLPAVLAAEKARGRAGEVTRAAGRPRRRPPARVLAVGIGTGDPPDAAPGRCGGGARGPRARPGGHRPRRRVAGRRAGRRDASVRPSRAAPRRLRPAGERPEGPLRRRSRADGLLDPALPAAAVERGRCTPRRRCSPATSRPPRRTSRARPGWPPRPGRRPAGGLERRGLGRARLAAEGFGGLLAVGGGIGAPRPRLVPPEHARRPRARRHPARRARRQRHHVRHRRPGGQAARGHGADEDRHVRRRRRALGARGLPRGRRPPPRGRPAAARRERPRRRVVPPRRRARHYGATATGGRASFVVHPLAPRALGSPVHTHSREDEWSYVLDGQVGLEVGGRVLLAGPGDLVLKPRGVRTRSGTPPTSRQDCSRSSPPVGSRPTSRSSVRSSPPPSPTSPGSVSWPRGTACRWTCCWCRAWSSNTASVQADPVTPRRLSYARCMRAAAVEYDRPAPPAAGLRRRAMARTDRLRGLGRPRRRRPPRRRRRRDGLPGASRGGRRGGPAGSAGTTTSSISSTA